MKSLLVFLIFSSLKFVFNSEFLYDAENDVVYYNNKKYALVDQYESKLKEFPIALTKEKFLTMEDGAPFYWYMISIIILTLFAGAMSGLTVGYLSIDDLVLELKTRTGSEDEKKQASKVLPILSQRHWLLCTLLISNAAAMETLPLFLNYLVPEILAIIISVTLVLAFGEIIPQAICTGPDQIKIAAFLAPFTKVFNLLIIVLDVCLFSNIISYCKIA
jgi:hypothetical protein